MDLRLTGEFRVLSPLTHIGETISTTAYLVQEPILQPDGSIEEVFVYSGNAWRGQLRDLAAEYLLDRLGNPMLGTEAFHLLFSGGRIGGTQSTNIEHARRFRRALPILALFGGGIGSQILPGKMRVRNSYPVCEEAIPALPPDCREVAAGRSYRGMTFEKSFSRKDDAKDPRLEARLLAGAAQQASLPGGSEGGKPARAERDGPADQMRMTVELLAAGAVLANAIDLLDVTEVEAGCLVSALHRFARSPHIGGQAGKGHGLVELDYELIDMDTGERQPFLAIAEGRARLMPPAEQALAAYDDYLRQVYDEFVLANRGEMVALLGAKAQ